MIIFSGDRSSQTIKIGKFLRKLYPNLVKIMLWDGYKSQIYIER